MTGSAVPPGWIWLSGWLSTALILMLSGCAGTPSGDFLPGEDGGPRAPVDVSHIPDAVPRVEPRSELGNPDSYVVDGRRYYVMQSGDGYSQRGIASWYGTKFHGRRTASGEPYNMYAMTAAHKTLPLPTYVRVTNLDNGRSVIVRVNDRGPFHGNRLIDLSYAAAKKLDVIATGTAPVEIRAIDPRSYQRAPVLALGQPSSKAPETKDTGLYLQVGAFASLQNAEQLRAQLHAVFDSVKISAGKTAAKATVYRVRIGPLGDETQAKQVAARLSKIGIAFSRVSLD